MPTGAKNVLYIRDLGMATYNLLNFKMRLVKHQIYGAILYFVAPLFEPHMATFRCF